MPDSDPLLNLLVQWDEARQHGEPPTPEQLCPDDPGMREALRRRIAHRLRIEVLLELPTVHYPETPPPPAPLPCLEGFEVLEVLGQGGMGVVYKARQRKLNRLVALKMILPEAAGTVQARGRFRAEAAAVAQLQHPNIAQIFEVGDQAGRPYLVLEFLGGGNLAEAVGGTPLPARRAAELVLTLARAIEHAHQKGIIHRDLKPSNVLLTDDGTPKITDFGLVKRLDSDPGLTQTGAIIGTPNYMAPEQAEGRGREVGPAVDVYALGAILYGLLTGRPPFQGTTILETLEQVRSHDPVPPRRLQPTVPVDLETVCLKCLEKSAAQRYVSAEALAADLASFLQGEPVRARPIGKLARAVRWARRRPAAAALLLVSGVALLALVGVGVGLWYSLRLAEQRDVATGARTEAEHQRSRAEEQERLGRRYLYAAQLNLAERAWQEARIDRMFELLDAQRPGPDAEDLRGFEWHYLWRLPHSGHRVLARHSAPVLAVAYSPDGRFLVAAGADHVIKVWDVASSRLAFACTGHTGAVNCVAFRPDGARLASAGQDGTVRLWDMADGREVRLVEARVTPFQAVAYSPDGQRVVTGGGGIGRAPLRVWDEATGRELPSLEGHLDTIFGVAVSPDGRRIASCGRDRIVRLWDADSGKLLYTCHGHADVVFQVAFSPDNKRLVSAGDTTVRTWNVETGRAVLACRGHTHAVRHAAFSTDGKRLVSTGTDRTVRVWDAATGSELFVLKGHNHWVTTLALRPDGKELATGGFDETVRVWDATGGQEAVVLPGRNGAVPGLAFSPDGCRLAAADQMGTVRTWDLKSGKVVAALPRRWVKLWGVAFSPDGRLLATAGEADLPTGPLRLWDASTGQEAGTLQGHKVGVRCLSFSPDGRHLASGSFDNTVRLWDVADRRETFVLEGHQQAVVALAFSPDGRCLASASEDRTVRIWDRSAGQPVLTLTEHGGTVASVAFSPDGLLATGDFGRTVRLWDPISGALLQVFKGHGDAVTGLAFSPDGRRLVSASYDRTIKLWDLETGQEVLTLRGHADGVSVVAFSPDGHRLASGSLDQMVRIWDATPR